MVTCRVSQVFARRFAAQGAAMLRQQPARHCSWMSVAGEKTLTDFEKRIMVWGGAFKNRFDVPSQVPHSMFVKCQERFRIKMNIYAMAATAIACTVVMYLGAEEAEMPGMTLHAQALRRHAEAAARGSY